MTLIVIAGTDGSGKGTQTKRLVERLNNSGKKVEYIEFPQYGKESAKDVEKYLNGEFGSISDVGPYRASEFFANDRKAASPQIKKWLSEGKIVIANRYVSANMGHQAAQIKDKSKVDEFLLWLEDLEFKQNNIPRPDLTLLLYVPAKIGQTLVDKKGHRDYVGGEKRDLLESDINHLEDASEAYLYVAKKYNWPIIECAPNGKLLSIEEIHELIWNEIQPVIQ